MAKYKVLSKSFINGYVQDPENPPPGVTEIILDMPDDFVPGFHLEPRDAAAERAMEKYIAKKEAAGVVTTGHDGRKSASPVDALPIVERPPAPAPRPKVDLGLGGPGPKVEPPTKPKHDLGLSPPVDLDAPPKGEPTS